MALTDNERIQEIFILIGDKLAPIRKVWWFALLLCLILTVPGYYVLKKVFVAGFAASYTAPRIIYTTAIKDPLQIIDKNFFTLPNNSYSSYVKIKNTNLEWGVAAQRYTVTFSTNGGTVLNTFTSATFILPASEKLIVIPRFTAAKKPDKMTVTLDPTNFIHKPNVSLDFEVQRTLLTNAPEGLLVSSAFINQTPFTISQIGLPVVIYNTQNQIVGVSYTSINQVTSSETHTFQYSWPGPVTGAVRAEIIPEINIFDRNLLSTEAPLPGSSSADRPQ